jgi:response regulator RpfG family c-di-GMP phosphodiesterase
MNPPLPPADAAHTILVVDDEPRVLAALKEVLERQQFHVVTTTDARRAIEMLQERPFSVVISDHLMPVMSGMDFLVECQRIQPHATRILITAVLSLPTLVEAINKGEIYRFLAKPWLREELIVTVRNALNRYELVTQNQRLLVEASDLNTKLSQANAALAEKIARLEIQSRSIDKANQELANRYDLSLELCSRILATYDPFLAGQTQAVAAIAVQMCSSEHLSPPEREALKTAAWLCDIGLIGVSREVYRSFRQNPERLTEREIAGIHNHPVYSQTLAANIDGRSLVAETIRGHHERFDGAGYPDGLGGEAIPWTARCLAVAVAYIECSLPSGRAMDFIDEQSGKALDPEAVRLFRTTTRLQPLPRSVREVMLEDLQPGMVLAGGIYSPHGLLLVGEGQPLNQGMIAKIRSHNLMTPISQRLLVYS